uniref:Large envelope protein n=1 Tax=White sucker hepatitis B virus TaxID=1690672 RepID=A0A7U3QRK2_9HEPA|nr:surface protein [White sucker hepatitis B virus]
MGKGSSKLMTYEEAQHQRRMEQYMDQQARTALQRLVSQSPARDVNKTKSLQWPKLPDPVTIHKPSYQGSVPPKRPRTELDQPLDHQQSVPLQAPQTVLQPLEPPPRVMQIEQPLQSPPLASKVSPLSPIKAVPFLAPLLIPVAHQTVRPSYNMTTSNISEIMDEARTAFTTMGSAFQGLSFDLWVLFLVVLLVVFFLLIKIHTILKAADWWLISRSFLGTQTCPFRNTESPTSMHFKTDCPLTCTGFRWTLVRRSIIFLCILALVVIFWYLMAWEPFTAFVKRLWELGSVLGSYIFSHLSSQLGSVPTIQFIALLIWMIFYSHIPVWLHFLLSFVTSWHFLQNGGF